MKLTPMITTLLVLLSLLTGCGSTTNPQQQTNINPAVYSPASTPFYNNYVDEMRDVNRAHVGGGRR